MRIEDEIKLTFDDVLIRPKRSTLVSRSEVQLDRDLKFRHTSLTWSGVPIVSANMDTTGTFETAISLQKHKMITAVHKFYTVEDWKQSIDKLDPNFIAVTVGQSDEDMQLAKDIFKLNDWIVKALICFDLRFPLLSFESKSDLLIYVANWPESRIRHWKSLLVARAIENQCYVIGVNRVGKDNNRIVYPGSSMVVDYNGEILTSFNREEKLAIINLSLEELQAYRRIFPFKDFS